MQSNVSSKGQAGQGVKQMRQLICHADISSFIFVLLPLLAPYFTDIWLILPSDESWAREES